ncbi:transposase [Colwellia sp. MB02u-10]|uniref:transposase n=1 Tax=Colwellia sp. MB02u-10 TaxID=2759828 RepID=UPI0028730F60|nr:transposase [Colwellia sp. MB02u-10]
MNVAGKSYTRFTGYLKDCKVCPLRRQCMRKAPSKTGRQLKFVNDSSTNVIN